MNQAAKSLTHETVSDVEEDVDSPMRGSWAEEDQVDTERMFWDPSLIFNTEEFKEEVFHMDN